MTNLMFVRRLSLLPGVLPARYSYATGGGVNIQIQDDYSGPAGGMLSLEIGQRDTMQPGMQQRGCEGRLGHFTTWLYTPRNMAFRSATPGPIHYHSATQRG